VTASVVPVSLLSLYIRQLFENDALLSDIWVDGEVSEVFVSRAGHVYFTLRDDQSQIKSVLFRGMAQRQRVLPAIGDNIVAHGRVTTYERDGTYQLYVDLVEHAGQGILALQFELLRQKLESEGLFDESRKRPLPAIPRVIAVVTSAEGAVWHDIQTVLRRRFPLVQLLLSPTPVQGSSAPDGIVVALERVQRDGRAEFVIVARGGGSAEDLACFNDERVARAVFGCRIPVISAIGHETDWTIIDLVADLRAPTPSAAAELCTPSSIELLDDICELNRQNRRAAVAAIQVHQLAVADFGRRLERLSPAEVVGGHRGEIDRMRLSISGAVKHLIGDIRFALEHDQTRLGHLVMTSLDVRNAQLALQSAVLDALDPMAVLTRGYAAIADEKSGEIIVNARAAESGQAIVARFADGEVAARVERVDAT
jgi:exodeoxyribonuclease VII large subunit